MILGHLKIERYLRAVNGFVSGCIITDAKDRQYRQRYKFTEEGDTLIVQREDGNGDVVHIPKTITLDESLVAFFGLYSGDGAKGSEDKNDSCKIIPVLSFSLSSDFCHFALMWRFARYCFVHYRHPALSQSVNKYRSISNYFMKNIFYKPYHIISYKYIGQVIY